MLTVILQQQKSNGDLDLNHEEQGARRKENGRVGQDQGPIDGRSSLEQPKVAVPKLVEQDR